LSGRGFFKERKNDIMIEKIYFDDTTFIWKTKLIKLNQKSSLLKEAYSVIESLPNVKTDGFGYKKEWNNNLNFIGMVDVETNLDYVVQKGIDFCKELYEEKNIPYNGHFFKELGSKLSIL
jgi:hypothetical protein